MIYLLYGNIDYSINDYVKKIIAKEKIEEINISKYNLDNNLNDIIEDASTISLFDDKKIIIVNSDTLFSSKKDIDTTNLEKYLENSNPNTIIIFVSRTETVDTRRKIYKLIKEKGSVVEFTKNVNVYEYTKKIFSEYQISNETINLLIKRVGNNPNTIYNEVNKLKIYKINDKLITNYDVINLTSNYIDTNIFKFIDNIINKKKKEAIITYHELLKRGEEPIKIIVMLSNQFRLMYQAKKFTNKGYTEDKIANILHTKRYPVHLAIQASYKYDDKILLKNLEELANLDINIKTGESDKDLALELYLLNL